MAADDHRAAADFTEGKSQAAVRSPGDLSAVAGVTSADIEAVVTTVVITAVVGAATGEDGTEGEAGVTTVVITTAITAVVGAATEEDGTVEAGLWALALVGTIRGITVTSLVITTMAIMGTPITDMVHMLMLRTDTMEGAWPLIIAGADTGMVTRGAFIPHRESWSTMANGTTSVNIDARLHSRLWLRS